MAAMSLTDTDLRHLTRCVDLAELALEAGDEPYGSLLVSGEGSVLLEDRNRVSGGDATRHPEIAIARWAAEHLDADARAAATVYTSGEHCPMCAAAHGWVGLGRIVYAASAAQSAGWVADLDPVPSPVRALPIVDIVPSAIVDGPADALAERLRALHRRQHGER